ncbi:Uncharacterized protein Adt_47507 [Abeliophyllum distichum]|uniref:Retrotransposon gag domain-containing protein n=1 Tax=Abeliophyllum distichum TaxID=126358 RepID=A0ABD1NWK0_9LAMI
MSHSHNSRVHSRGRTGSQHVNLPQVFRRRQQGETSAQTRAPERDAVLQKLEYLSQVVERLEKNQATTRQISDSEAESPARDKSKDRRVKRRLDFGDKSPSESKGGKSIRSSPPRKATSQRSVIVFDHLGQSSRIPHEKETRREKGAPSMAASSVQDTPDELEMMKKRLAELEAKQKNAPEEYTTDRHSPFTEDILAKPLPKKLKMPQLTSYEDGNDPVGHLDRYTSWMELQGASDAIMCRAFPLTFGNRAMRWFKKLPQRSIRSWNDLLGQFVSTFMGVQTRSTPKERLVSIKQGRTESLRSYMDRFSKRIVEVDKISDDAALMAVLSGLRTKTRFWWSVHEDGSATYQEFLGRAEKHISAEEATSDQENDKSDRRDNMKSKEKDLKPEKKESPKKVLEFQHTGRPRPTPPRYQGYHVLNTSLENVLMKTRGKDILKKPVPMKASSSELNQKRYCRYHRSTGHDTDDCRDLKGEIESLIRRGHLKEFVARPTGGGEPPEHQDRAELPPPPQHGRGEIHMIVGRSRYLEGSRRHRRKLSREAHNSYQVLSGTIANPNTEKFSFSEEDASHVLQPHSDALVITMPVSGVNIHRTLVDDGSSVNVLYLKTFNQMDIDARHIRPFPKPLQGFTGDYVSPKGHIALVVELRLPPATGESLQIL